jgi:hypothetical protein
MTRFERGGIQVQRGLVQAPCIAEPTLAMQGNCPSYQIAGFGIGFHTRSGLETQMEINFE